MDQDDPEKRIADLERQLADARAADDPGASQRSQPPPAWTPFPAQPGLGQPVAPFDWQNPPPSAPSAFSFPSAPREHRGGRIAWILLAAGLPIVILVVVAIVVTSALHHATKSLV